ncbi:2,3-bisphosphoglycerate-independent phosphoglycerate mutase 1 [Frankliniella fusca]|uniref:2,3-bisphosphoglycerate-independent phosphoglycerate mutase 1 n=1 Tax=Frankliniella fusca TaxID=407009 RepID=A0AAE1LGX0_9NEOP|nr:2,3-bisphosphoglycerate-independent phosphoglycerate mutase 1 [Frankliniella fusca]
MQVIMGNQLQITDTSHVLVQFVFDNADFNISTIDGLNTFHVMGGIKCISPARTVSLEFDVPRCSGSQTVDAALHGAIPLSPYKPSLESGFQKITVEDLRPGQPYQYATVSSLSRDNAANFINFLWLAGTVFQPAPTPGWTGFLQKATSTSPPCEKTVIVPVSFINLEARNPTIICTALEYAISECKAIEQKTCIVTFDQPLFMKATEVVSAAENCSPLQSVVVSLGGFHLLMPFMHAVSYLMAGSGLEELWGTLRNEFSTTAKAFSRALRGHFFGAVLYFCSRY